MVFDFLIKNQMGLGIVFPVARVKNESPFPYSRSDPPLESFEFETVISFTVYDGAGLSPLARATGNTVPRPFLIFMRRLKVMIRHFEQNYKFFT
ncbi:hypothetical protein CCP2SC5_1060010 [Azospirillaceae bacterium]